MCVCRRKVPNQAVFWLTKVYCLIFRVYCLAIEVYCGKNWRVIKITQNLVNPTTTTPWLWQINSNNSYKINSTMMKKRPRPLKETPCYKVS